MDLMLEHVISGQTIPDTDNAVAFATRIALASQNRRSCGIAIANCTKYKLVNPRSHIHAGTIISRPAEINPDCTGLITAEKKYGSTWGAVGLITYAIEGTKNRLQIYYDVPMQRLMFDVKANVMVGFKTASMDLFEDMDKEVHGEMILAKCTMHSKKNIDGYNIDFLMEDAGKCPLTVFLRHHNPEARELNGVTSTKIVA